MVRTEKAGSQAEKIAAEQMDALDLDDFLFSEGDDADILLLDEMMGDVGVPNGGVVQDMEFESLETKVIDAGDKSLTNQATANSTTTKKGSKRKGTKKNNKKNKSDKNDSGDSSKRTSISNNSSSSNFVPQNYSSNNNPKTLPSFENNSFNATLNNTNKNGAYNSTPVPSSASETRSKANKNENIVASDKDKKNNKKKEHEKASSTSNHTAPKSSRNNSRREYKKKQQQKLDGNTSSSGNANSSIGLESHITNSLTNNNNNVGSRPPPLLPTRHFSPGISTIRKTGKLQRPNNQNQNITQIIKPSNAQSSTVTQSTSSKKRQGLKRPTTNNSTNNSINSINNTSGMVTNTVQKEQLHKIQQDTNKTNKSSSLGHQSIVQSNHHLQLPQSQPYAPKVLQQQQQQDHYTENNHHDYGLKPSNQLFFPFLPLPKEVSMRRCNKMFPILDEIHNSVMEDRKQQQKQQQSSTFNEKLDQHPLYQLLTDTNISNGPDNHTFHGSSYPPSQAGSKLTSTSMQSIEQTKKFVLSKLSRDQIQLELKSALYLLNRQNNFLNQSLSNMKTWCQENFKPIEYRELYSNEEQDNSTSMNNKKRKLSLSNNSNHLNETGIINIEPGLPSSTNSAKSTTTTTVMIPKLIRITLKFAGYNYGNNSKDSELFAQILNPIQVPVPSDILSSFEKSNGISMDLENKEKNESLRNSSTENYMDKQQPSGLNINYSQNKKQTGAKIKKQQNNPIKFEGNDKLDSSETQNTKQYEPESEIDLYTKRWSNKERSAYLCKNINKKISKHAKLISSSDKQRYEDLISRENERSNILKETDDLLLCNTFTMWRIMNNAMNYMTDIKSSDIFDELSSLWQPELPYRELNYDSFPTAQMIKISQPAKPSSPCTQQKTKPVIQNKDTFAEESLFYRLQSLLVDEQESEDYESDKEAEHDPNHNSSNYLKESNQNVRTDIPNDMITDNDLSSELDYVTESEDSIDEEDLDVSALSLDQRTFIHLRALHLIDRPLIPSTKPVVIENEEDESCTSLHECKKNFKTSYKEDIPLENDIDSIIRSMQLDLSNINRTNNESLAFLQASADTYISNQTKKEKKKEEDASLLSKHAQLMKKQKESRKAAKKVKQSAADQDWIPW